VATEQPSLVVLDLGLPDKSGIEVCREIRRWSQAPIVVLSARHQDTEKAALLDAGADDYVTKPFSTVELVARLRVQLRRVRAERSTTPVTFAFGDWRVDLQLRRIERAGVAVHLTPTEFALLRTFLLHPRQTLTHRQLFSGWGNASGDAAVLAVIAGHLRESSRRSRATAIHPDGVGRGY
jgi:two-component system KDP operon response regulator KdpE